MSEDKLEEDDDKDLIFDLPDDDHALLPLPEVAAAHSGD